ncbi:MAG: Ion-translocating oxidoreductase complex subunit D [Gammaproteobacteria bacterium]|nr:Ion-translocating oxidoreductase complex subunit D [Gammaproteobacteria bacterium]
MGDNTPQLVLSSAPFQKRPVDTPLVMRHVLYSLIPVMLAAIYFFGISALLIILVCVFGCVLTEWICSSGPLRNSSLLDGSAVLTAVLLALTLPPGIALWMAFAGGVISILLGKILFGGLGQNIFNPSLTGRAFLQACFPVPLTTWAPNMGFDDFFTLRGDLFTFPFTTPHFDAISAATPLARMKFDREATDLLDLLLGTTSGSLGETSAILILLGGAYLAYRQFLNWRVPVGIFLAAFVTASLLHGWDAGRHPDGVFHLFSGGLMLGAVYMATDPVTSPVTPIGSWVYAICIGVLVVAIRQFGGLTEGVMYAILFMNAWTPMIDRVTQPRTYGTIKTETSPGDGND